LWFFASKHSGNPVGQQPRRRHGLLGAFADAQDPESATHDSESAAA